MTAQILRRLMHRYGLLLVLTVLGGVAGAAYSAVKTPTYRATAYVVVTADAGEPFAAVNFAQAYGRVVTTGPAAENAAKTIGSGAAADLARVTASTSPDAPVIEITAAGPDAGRVQVAANAVAQGLIDFAATRKAETRVGVSMLAQATKPARPSSPKPPLEMAVGAAAGLLLAGLAALAGVGRTALARRRDTDPAEGDSAVGSAATQRIAVPFPRQYALAPPRPTLSMVLTPPATVSASATVSSGVAAPTGAPTCAPVTVAATAAVPVSPAVPGGAGVPASAPASGTAVPVSASAAVPAGATVPPNGAVPTEARKTEAPKVEVLEGQIDESRIVGRAVVIYREES